MEHWLSACKRGIVQVRRLLRSFGARAAILVFAALAFLVWYLVPAGHTAESPTPPASTGFRSPETPASPTNVYAHNLMLRKGPSFRVYVRWLRGKMLRTRPDINPSFDDPESFLLDIDTGVLRANIGDIGNFLNAGGAANSPLKNIALSGNGDQIKLKGTLHKVFPIPIELNGTIAALPDNRIQIHVTKLNVLKIPFKAVLRGLNITIADLFKPERAPGIQVAGNDIYLDTQTLLPPPRIRGRLTGVRVINPDLEGVYGNAKEETTRVEQWRNFLQLRDGTIDFGKLTMRQVDLIMIDLSDDAWFDLDLTHYQEQLVNGYTRMTPQAGLQIFMPDLDKIPRNKKSQDIGIEWFKNRNMPPPPGIGSK